MTNAEGLKFGEGYIFADYIKIKGIVIKYDDIKYFRYSDVSTVVNAIPLHEELKIIIYARKGRSELYEKVDIRPSILRMPITHLFDSRKRKENKRTMSDAQLRSKISFNLIVKHIQEKTGIKGNDLSEIQEGNR